MHTRETGSGLPGSNFRKLRDFFLRPSSLSLVSVVAIGMICGLMFWGAFNTGMEATNSLEFCTSCHEMRDTVFQDPQSYFHRYATLSDQEAVKTATSIWTRINLLNLNENILPTRQRADLILRKGESHLVEEVALRKL